MNCNVLTTLDAKMSNDLQLVKTCGEQTQGIIMPIAAKEFTIFSKLPSEIQLNTWSTAESDSNIITLREFLDRGDQLRARYVVPALLHTTNDSRKEALKRYRSIQLDGRLKVPVYFDPTKDMLLFSNQDVILRFADKELKPFLDNDMIRFIAIAGSVDYLYNEICAFPNLQRCTLEDQPLHPPARAFLSVNDRVERVFEYWWERNQAEKERKNPKYDKILVPSFTFLSSKDFGALMIPKRLEIEKM